MDTPKSLVCLSMSPSYLLKRQRCSLDLSRRELGTFAGAKGYGKRNQNYTQTFLLASFMFLNLHNVMDFIQQEAGLTEHFKA
ncbi:hypothetical protein Avbf_08766 [Armadillidium vulgare]|nr:hypothetical protein Avbf_08766 [Armadillidium vulgare]